MLQVLNIKEVALPESCLALAEGQPAHLVTAEFGGQAGHAMSHGVLQGSHAQRSKHAATTASCKLALGRERKS